MRKSLLSVVVLSLLSSSATAFAEGWKMFPVKDADYQAKASVAIIAGQSKFDGSDQGVKGLEASFTCPLIKLPKHSIRQQLSYTTSKEDGIKVKSLEMNPHHMFQVNNKLQVGVGPSLGVTKLESNGKDDSVLSYGVGASVRYDITRKVFIGAETRYAWTDEANLNGVKDDINNRRSTVKVGFNF